MKPKQVVLVISLIALVVANIISSQTISPLYFRVIDLKKDAVSSFLYKIKDHPLFAQMLNSYANLFGLGFESQVFQESIKRKEKIRRFEAVLQRNPKAKDVLYALSILYNEEGDERTAQEYLKRAKEIDPEIR